ncbi:MAG TPA: NAD(P)/FAD-dependent oxidoreductase [Candidatus Micrarchaeia archaeon]|nr:NAD(P)/FAD-dependent oxidoreductase [Candidatus Micrarchaeia archaeon]
MRTPLAAAARRRGRPRVVVVGAGFAGLAVVEGLRRQPVRVTLVDRHTYHTFQPLLYQVATGGLNPGDIAFPARALVRRGRRTAFRQGELTGVDWEHRRIELADGGVIPYDYLVLAFGATTNYFGVPGAAEHSRPIYTLDDALAVRNQMVRGLEHAAAFGAATGELTAVIVGGGATGIEMAGTLAELGATTLRRDYPQLDRARARVVLVEQRDHLLTAFPARLRRYALAALVRRGVEVRLRESVGAVGPEHVVLGSGEVIPAGLVLWAAGVGVDALAARLGLVQGPGGRLVVEPDLRASGHAEVFIAGDLAAAGGPGGTLLPQLAQPAIQAGRHVAHQIRSLAAGDVTRPFHYRGRGIMATIGRRAAVAELAGGLQLSGTLAWAAWLGLHLVTLLGVRNRLSVLLNWAWHYVTWRGGARVIVGG